MTGTAPTRHRWGARARITIVVTLAFTIAAATLSFVLVDLLRSQLIRNVDQANDQRARDISTLLDSEANDEGPVDFQLPPSRGDSDIAQVLTSEGSVLTASSNLRGEPPLLSNAGRPITVPDLEIGSQTAPYRLDSLTRTTSTGSGQTIIVGRSLVQINDTIRTISVELVLGVPTLALVVALLTWTAVARSLRSVEAIREEFSRTTATDLSRRVPHPGTNDEVGALADTLNQTLELLEQDVQTQQRFVADAAHELRSPLAALTAQIELVRTTPGQASAGITMASLLQQARRLEQLIDDLLLLARHDAGPADQARYRLVDLDEVVLEEALRARLTSAVPIDTRGVSSAQVRGDADSLQRVVRNLVDNAARHARSSITLTLGESESSAVLHVDDDGPGVPAEQRARVFERFARLDTARDRRTGGTGLGLAISNEIVNAHHGTIDVSESPTGGARFTVTLAAASPVPTRAQPASDKT